MVLNYNLMRKLATQQGKTLADVSREVDLPNTTFSRIKNGVQKDVTLGTAIKIANGLHIDDLRDLHTEEQIT